MADSGNNKKWPEISYGPFDPKKVGITSESSMRDMQVETLAQVLKLQAMQEVHNSLYTALEVKQQKLKELLESTQAVQVHHTKEFVEVLVKMNSFKEHVKKLFETMSEDIQKSGECITAVRALEEKLLKLKDEMADAKGSGKRKNEDEDAAASEPAKRAKEEPSDEDLDVTQTLAYVP